MCPIWRASKDYPHQRTVGSYQPPTHRRIPTVSAYWRKSSSISPMTLAVAHRIAKRPPTMENRPMAIRIIHAIWSHIRWYASTGWTWTICRRTMIVANSHRATSTTNRKSHSRRRIVRVPTSKVLQWRRNGECNLAFTYLLSFSCLQWNSNSLLLFSYLLIIQRRGALRRFTRIFLPKTVHSISATIEFARFRCGNNTGRRRHFGQIDHQDFGLNLILMRFREQFQTFKLLYPVFVSIEILAVIFSVQFGTTKWIQLINMCNDYF